MEKKPVTVKSLVKDKKRIAYLLSITASGDKLEPYVIFQGKKYSSINKELNKYVEINKLNIITRTKSRAWIDEELFPDYNDGVLIKYKPKNKNYL